MNFFNQTASLAASLAAVSDDDIFLTSSNEAGILATKAYRHQHFFMRDLQTPHYFLGISLLTIRGNQLSPRVNTPYDTMLLGCKLVTLAMGVL